VLRRGRQQPCQEPDAASETAEVANSDPSGYPRPDMITNESLFGTLEPPAQRG
jgi:hypothetical protein